MLLAAFDRSVLFIYSFELFFVRENLFHRNECALVERLEENSRLEMDILVTLTVAEMRVADVMRLLNIGELNLVFVIVAIRTMHDEVPDPTICKTHALGGYRKSVGTPPLRQMLVR